MIEQVRGWVDRVEALVTDLVAKIAPCLYLGLKRKSALLLDDAGCPMWLIRLLVPPPPKDWGTLLYILAANIGYPVDEEEDNDD